MVEAETEHGERLSRCWRHEGVLTPDALVARLRWQRDGWLTGPRDTAGDTTGGLILVRIAPHQVVPAVGRQLGFWGGDAAAGDPAHRALARLQGMLGPDAVVTASPCGGRRPTEPRPVVPAGDPPTLP